MSKHSSNVWLPAGRYPIVLASTSAGGGLGDNLKASSQTVAAADDTLYVAAHGSANGMRLTGTVGVQDALTISQTLGQIMGTRLSANSASDRRVRWMNESGGTHGLKNLGAYVQKGQAPFGPGGRFTRLVLVSCSTGAPRQNGSYFAQDLADHLGVEVIAPRRRVNVPTNGAHPVVRKVGATGYETIGTGWRVFAPQGNAPTDYPGGELPSW